MKNPTPGVIAPLESQGPSPVVAAVTAGSLWPKNLSLNQYLRREISRGVTHFTLSAHIHHRTKDVNFYIHPSQVSGDTQDFVLSEDPFNENYDFIYNKAGSWTDEQLEQKAAEFLALLRSQRGARENVAGEPRGESH